MRVKTLKSVVLAALTASILAGCASSANRQIAETVVPSGPPPPPRDVEMASPMPDPDYVWIKGVWVWSPDDQWVWETGHWEMRPYSTATWMPAHYEFRNGQHLFVRGEWD